MNLTPVLSAAILFPSLGGALMSKTDLSTEVLLMPGGKLIDVYLDPNNLTYKKDVTKFSFSHIFSTLELDPAVTLKDIFLLIQSNMDAYSSLLGNWVEEYVEEGLTPLLTESPKTFTRLELKYLIQHWDQEQLLSGTIFPELYAFALDENGNEILYGVETLPANLFANLPISLNRKGVIKLVKEGEIPEIEEDIVEYQNIHFTLGSVLNAVIKAFSIYGGPSDRNKFIKTIEDRLESLSDGNSWNDIKKELGF